MGWQSAHKLIDDWSAAESETFCRRRSLRPEDTDWDLLTAETHAYVAEARKHLKCRTCDLPVVMVDTPDGRVAAHATSLAAVLATGYGPHPARVRI